MKEASIGIIFSGAQKEVLLIKRRDVPVWVLPGGGIEANELPEEAVIREVFEETGLSVRSTRKVGTWFAINRLSSTAHVFECDSLEPLPEKFSPQPESIEVRFWPVDRLPPGIFFLHEEWVVAALKNNHAPIIAKMTNVTYLAVIKFFICHPMLVFRHLLARLGYPINNR